MEEFFEIVNPNILALIAVICLFLTIWEIIWKGFALWKAARNNDIAWFICIMAINTAGILPIVYILLNRNKNKAAIIE